MNRFIFWMLARRVNVSWSWPASYIISFYRSLSSAERVCFLLGVAPLPIYVAKGHFFMLLDAIRNSILGESVPIVMFLTLLGETLLVIYAIALFIRFKNSRGQKSIVRASRNLSLPHKCITVCPVPLHLYNEENRAAPANDDEIVKAFTGLNPDDQALIDNLPQALDILKNNAAMLDLYDQRHPKADHGDSDSMKPKSLMDILKEHQLPEIQTSSDIEQIIQSSNK